MPTFQLYIPLFIQQTILYWHCSCHGKTLDSIKAKCDVGQQFRVILMVPCGYDDRNG
jgi:hypothetical protein